MDRPEELLIIRHPESARNRAKKGNTYFADDEARKQVVGIPDQDTPLTDFGKEQALQTGVYLKKRFDPPHYFYHSGYKRTEDAVDLILQAWPASIRSKIKVRMNPFIRERDPGYTFDMMASEAEKFFPYLKAYWETFGGFFARPPGGESLADVSARVYTFLNMIFRDRAGQRVWVDTHGGTIRACRFLLERWKYTQALHWPKGESPKNCGITRYKFSRSKQRLVLKEYNTVGWQ